MAITPTARGLTLCESVAVDAETRNLTLQHCFRALRADRFPAVGLPFFVTAHLVNGLGDVTLRVVIRSLSDNREAYRFERHVRLQDRLQEVRVKFEIRTFVAHTAGRFGVELWANDDLAAQTDFSVLGGVS